MKNYLFSDAAVDFFAKKIDDAKEWKQWYIEMIDGKIAQFSINMLDEKLGSKVPDPYRTEIRDLIDVAINDVSPNLVIREICDLLDEHIDLSGIDPENEKKIFDGLSLILQGFLSKFLTK